MPPVKTHVVASGVAMTLIAFLGRSSAWADVVQISCLGTLITL
jgi:hypothetical protein